MKPELQALGLRMDLAYLHPLWAGKQRIGTWELGWGLIEF